jgi:hypothetical protein
MLSFCCVQRLKKHQKIRAKITAPSAQLICTERMSVHTFIAFQRNQNQQLLVLMNHESHRRVNNIKTNPYCVTSFLFFTVLLSYPLKSSCRFINPDVSTKYYDRSFKMSISSLENVLPGGGVHGFSTWKSKVGIQWVLFSWFWSLTSFWFFDSNSYLEPSPLFF